MIDLDYQQLNGTWYSDEFHALTCDAQQLVVYNVDVTNMLQFLAMNEDALVWLCSNYTKLKELVENSST